MGKVEQHDLSEYHIYLPGLDVAAGSVMAHIPIPQSGQVKRVRLVMTTAMTTAASDITFELGGVAMTSGGTAATIVIGATDAVGICHTLEFDPAALVNEALECVDGEQGIGASTKSVLEIITDNDGTAGVASFVVTIGR